MSDAEHAFAEATDQLIGLYQSVERRTLDLPFISVMPLLILFWAISRFYFFLFVGVFLIIPVNLVIAIRNLFPGKWRYRPFFLRHLYYVGLWVWRGEAPIGPSIFVRPLLIIFMKGHFHTRLKRLRLEILFSDGLSDTARSALLARVDAAIERWKSPQLAAIFTTILLPTIASFPTWYKQVSDFLGMFEVTMPQSLSANFAYAHMSPFALHSLFALGLTFLVAIPMTAFLAKRGLFLEAEPRRLCFPGWQDGSGIYAKEKAILGSVGVRRRETPGDLWLWIVSFVLSLPLALVTRQDIKTSFPALPYEAQQSMESHFVIQTICQMLISLALFGVAAFRRGRAGRC